MIKYTSDSATHVWAEIVDHIDRDTIDKDLDTIYVCPMTAFEDEYDHVMHTIDPSDPTSWTWTTPYDSIDKTEAKITTYMYTYHVLPLQALDESLYPISGLMNYITIKRGTVLDMTAAATALFNLIDADYADSIMAVDGVDSILWEYSLDNVTFAPIPATPLATEAIVLRYRLVTECADDTVTSALYYNTTRDTLVVDDACNSYVWETNTYYTDTLDSVIYPLANGCDSIVEMKITIDHPYQQSLSLVSKYGDRLLMINRNEINGIDASYQLDLDNDTALVKWYKEATPEDEFLGYGYYYTKSNGDVLDAGVYYAILEIPASEGQNCGLHGETMHYAVAGAAAAPALVPSLARPGEDIKVLNLDPEKETIIRIYTTEGLLHGMFTVRGETSFTIKAANEVGFYLVELTNDGLKSTLRYIVK